MKEFFFGSSDSPLFMFQHALGMLLLFIFFFLFLAAIISWLSGRRKKKNVPVKVVEKKIISVPEKKEEQKPIAVLPEEKKEIVAEAVQIVAEKKIIPVEVVEKVSIPISIEEEVEVYAESSCNLKDHLLHYTEILLNKKLTEAEWDRRLPEQAMLDHKSYHELVYLLLKLHHDEDQTVSRFKLVLETSTEIAVNHQIYFRNWAMPENLVAAFKAEMNSTADEKRIRAAIKISEKKNWKLQSSTSEQGTMINLLMKLQLPK